MIKKISYIFLLLLVFLIFRNLLTFKLVSSGDFLKIENVNLVPYIWDWNFAIGGLGGLTLGFSWLHFILVLPTILLKNFGLNWEIIQKIAYIYPLIILLVFSPIMIFKRIFPKNNFYFFSAFVFAFNSYILMLIGGGQIYVALAYSLFPIVLYQFIKSFDLKSTLLSKRIKHSIITGLLFTLQSMIDLRIAYISIVSLIVYIAFNINYAQISRQSLKKKLLLSVNKIIYLFVIPFGLTALLHSFWLIPMIIIRDNPLSNLGAIYSTAGAVKFFSFARFENTISLLHPNWPENLFGKVYFMRPEFLLLPILAFSSLFFLKSLKNLQEKKNILFFCFLALLGAFFAKGANYPFGGIYIFLFEHIPGFMMFRDASKFYVLIALSYSILIPFTVSKIYEFLKNKQLNKNKILNVQNIFLSIVILYLLFLIRPALLGQLNGTFKSTVMPQDYVKLEKFLSSRNNFSRTFWLPTVQRFGFYSNNHPAIPAKDFFKLTDNSKIINLLKKDKFLLQEAGVKYVIIPFDSQGEIYLKDRKYDKKTYLKTITDVSKISWLKRVEGFDKIAVFEVPNPKDHFYIDTKKRLNNESVSYEYINPTEYRVTVKNVRKGDLLVFSESFDSRWILKDRTNIKSQKYNKLFNSFVLPKDGSYSFTVYYEPQKWVNIGLIISGFTLVSILFLFGFGYITKKW
jgi:hypothetical protein